MTEDGRSGLIAGFVGGVLLLILVALGGLLIVYTGAYNVAATEEHNSLTRWALDTSFHKSVERRASSITPPEAFTPQMVAAGGSAYKAMCQHCHAGPAADRETWASGMRPRPPHLAEAAAHWEPRQVFWIVKHGVKMSGMPAFGPSHKDDEIWNLAAFVKALPGMSPDQYAAIPSKDHEGGLGGGETKP